VARTAVRSVYPSIKENFDVSLTSSCQDGFEFKFQSGRGMHFSSEQTSYLYNCTPSLAWNTSTVLKDATKQAVQLAQTEINQ
jgi:hypothetical protein